MGAPTVASAFTSHVALWTGTMWHEFIHNTLRRQGVPYMAELNVTPWLPAGWGGTADAVVWNPELKAFVLVDFKTQKGEGMRYILRDGAKPEHQAQASAYWHAIKRMGIPIAKAVAVYYLPKNDTRSKDELIEPALMDFAPQPWKSLQATMAERAERADAYRASIKGFKGPEEPLPLRRYLTPELEAPQARQQRVYFDRKTETWELKLVPHWSAAYCPFPNELCDCSEQGTTKLGIFDADGTYYPRPGYEEIQPEVAPS